MILQKNWKWSKFTSANKRIDVIKITETITEKNITNETANKNLHFGSTENEYNGWSYFFYFSFGHYKCLR